MVFFEILLIHEFFIVIQLLISVFKHISRISNSKIAVTVETCGILHNELMDLLEDVTKFFFVPILIALITCFLQIVACMNLMYLILRKNRVWYISDVIIINYIVVWSFLITLEFFLISTVSGNLCETVRKIKNHSSLFKIK